MRQASLRDTQRFTGPETRSAHEDVTGSAPYSELHGRLPLVSRMARRWLKEETDRSTQGHTDRQERTGLFGAGLSY